MDVRTGAAQGRLGERGSGEPTWSEARIQLRRRRFWNTDLGEDVAEVTQNLDEDEKRRRERRALL